MVDGSPSGTSVLSMCLVYRGQKLTANIIAMAKRANPNNTSSPVKSTLIRSKDEVENLIERQIEAASYLLDFNVPFTNTTTGYDIFGGGGHQKKEYDKSKKEEFFNEYCKWDERNKDIFSRSFMDVNNTDYDGYKEAGRHYAVHDIVEEKKTAIKAQVSYMEGFIARLDLISCSASIPFAQASRTDVDQSKVFIVHGHNNEVKLSVARTIEQLGLTAIILHEQEDNGRTIIEKFESNTEDVGFAVVILTADDWGISKKEKDESAEAENEVDFHPRARQNVVFEMGYFIGKLDRAHTFLLIDEGVEKPGDLDGIVYTPYDIGGSWKLKLAKELKAVGYKVDLNKISI